MIAANWAIEKNLEKWTKHIIKHRLYKHLYTYQYIYSINIYLQNENFIFVEKKYQKKTEFYLFLWMYPLNDGLK